MKCPKCQYISFDSGNRCRNCGYEFSLSEDAPGDLDIKTGAEALGPFSDFSLNDAPNLPLFTADAAGDPDAPLVAPRATPRAPLAVRRTAPAAAKPKTRREDTPAEPWLALDTADFPPGADARAEPPTQAEEPAAPPPSPVDTGLIAASTGARIAGGIIDVGLVAAIDLAVIYLTLRICDLTFGEVMALPMAPLITFLLLLNGGYLATFVAASGQTIGKMAAGTRVVSADPGAPLYERVSFGQSTLRAGAYVVSALPLGLGFVPAFAGVERRALHDRLADTRVVKA